MGGVLTQAKAQGRMPDRARRVVLRLPPLRWRDERIAELREANQELRDADRLRRQRLSEVQQDATRLRSELATARDTLVSERIAAEARLAAVRDEAEARVREARIGPSFGSHLRSDRRVFDHARLTAKSADEDPTRVPRVSLMGKLKAYCLAESHGVSVPEVLAVWDDLDAIEWDGLPDTFVLKSAGGFSSHGVYPLRRVPGGFQVVGDPRLRTPEDITAALRRNAERRRVRGPYFAEVLLEQRDEPGHLPTDHKLYAFYGTVGHVLLRRMAQHGNTRTAHWQYLDRDGVDLGDVAEGRTVDPGLPKPPKLAEFVDIAERLSRAVPTPMIRVDLYDTTQGVQFGEFTVMPGGQQTYREDHDRTLGELWEQAAGRLQHDLANGRPYALLHGEHPVHTPCEPTRGRPVIPDPATDEPLRI